MAKKKKNPSKWYDWAVYGGHKKKDFLGHVVAKTKEEATRVARQRWDEFAWGKLLVRRARTNAQRKNPPKRTLAQRVKKAAYRGTNDEYVFQGYSAEQWRRMGRGDIARILDRLTRKNPGTLPTFSSLRQLPPGRFMLVKKKGSKRFRVYKVGARRKR